ncbi:gp34 [Mycobacterium phage PLot]|uniref:Uncharacterized protein n=5 Tax=Plotvirus plot TaxID=2170099 RepID=Q19YB5_9CAUD|nr:gp34 [Mycobacterium phage PLot]ABD58633.1 hypothetical protein PBI_PLOT_34 [Mycobacterium phage PLot]AER49786.1 hypothetical protein NOVA_33 [Mycobacterium phage Nova]AWY03477.1 hypothetical protein ERK16_33 [Mycobacterium phage Erk16]AYN58175.1 hypothetical protein SEA_KANDZ_33 [Mycobacterium phage KandZ]
MNTELQAIKDAMNALDFDTARDLAKLYVENHPEEFVDYYQIVEESANEEEAIAKVVTSIEVLRAAGLTQQQYRGETFHLFRWDPQNIGATTEPVVRNPIPPTVRND